MSVKAARKTLMKLTQAGKIVLGCGYQPDFGPNHGQIFRFKKIHLRRFLKFCVLLKAEFTHQFPHAFTAVRWDFL